MKQLMSGIILCFLSFVLMGCSSSTQPAGDSKEAIEQPTAEQEAPKQPTNKNQQDTKTDIPLADEINTDAELTSVIIETEFGNMEAVLYNSTPLHRDNFIKHAKDGYYNDLLFHRVIDGFMIQGGDPDSRGAAPGVSLGRGGPGYLIDAEIGAPHIKGTLAAARTGGPANPEMKSSGSQFYIVDGKPVTEQMLSSIERSGSVTYTEEQKQAYIKKGGTPQLDGAYTVFGEVIIGEEVIDKIAATKTGGSDRPQTDVSMKVRLK